MSLADSTIAQVLLLQTGLYHAVARIEAGTDSEALHDLRINLRRMRSLLRPLRKIAGVALLDEAAAEVGKLTTPVRDLEVLIEELERQPLRRLANVRKASLHSSYSGIVASPAIKQLFSRLDEWLSDYRAAERAGELRQIRNTIAKCLHKQIERLTAALADPQHDRHHLRLLVKRARYLTEAYPRLSPLSNKTAASLKTVQSALGSWHDHYQWCLKARQEQDLQPLQLKWQAAAAAALMSAEVELINLSELLTRNPRP